MSSNEDIKIYPTLKKDVKEIGLVALVAIGGWFFIHFLRICVNILLEYLGFNTSHIEATHIPVIWVLCILMLPFMLYNFIVLRFIPYIRIDKDKIRIFYMTYENIEFLNVHTIIFHRLEEEELVIYKKDGTNLSIKTGEIDPVDLFLLMETLKNRAKHANFTFSENLDDAPKIALPDFLY